jgi:hypothetical protein
MILHHPSTDHSMLMTRSWVVDTASLSLARVSPSHSLRLKVEAIRPSDHDAPFVSVGLEPFSPSTFAARILKNLREHIHREIKLQGVTLLEQVEEEVPEYLDFYELDGDGISIMRTSEPVFIAPYDGDDWITEGPFRFRNDISGEGWAYFYTEAYEELHELNALLSRAGQ